jgi:hypothetical protein
MQVPELLQSADSWLGRKWLFGSPSVLIFQYASPSLVVYFYSEHPSSWSWLFRSILLFLAMCIVMLWWSISLVC